METQILPASETGSIDQACLVLRQGGLVAFPTDTVYGVGALFTDEAAIEQLYLAKRRDSSRAIAVLIGRPGELAQVAAEMSPLAQRLAQRFWPGPLTLVVARRTDLPANLSPRPTIGVRMPDHPVALRLLNRVGPLAVTSANLSGQPDCVTASEVFDQLQGRLPLILDGGLTPGSLPSTVVDCTTTELIVLRPGPISYSQLLDALG